MDQVILYQLSGAVCCLVLLNVFIALSTSRSAANGLVFYDLVVEASVACQNVLSKEGLSEKVRNVFKMA